MAKRKKNRSIKDLYRNRLLFTQTLSLISKGISYRKIQAFLKSQKFNASLGLVENFVKKVKESKAKNIPLDKLIDKRAYNKRKKSIQDVAKAGRLKLNGVDAKTRAIVSSSLKQAKNKVNHVQVLPRNHFYSDREVLDMQIDQYRDELQAHNLQKGTAKNGLTAINMELKYSGDDSLSLQAIKQYQLIVEAHFSAIAQVAEEMMPKPKYEEFIKRVSKVEDTIQQQTQVSPDGKRLYNALKGFDLD